MSDNTYLQNLLRPDWRYRARLGIVPVLAKIARLAGARWETLGRILGREVLFAQAREFSGDVAANRNTSPLKVAFVTMLGGQTHNAGIDIVLALACRARGHEVMAVLCDQALPVCEVKGSENTEEWERSCSKCWAFGSRLFASFGIPFVRVTELVGEAATTDPEWDEYVESALLKHYRVGILDDSENVRERRGMFEDAAAISAAVARRLIGDGYDRVIMSHGLYCTWGPALKSLTDAGVPVVVYAKGKQKAKERFSWNASADWPHFVDEWLKVKDVPLNEAERNALHEYLGTRRSHSQDTLVYNFGPVESDRTLYEKLGIDPAKPVYTAFTNVLWDASSAQREIAFDDAMNWIFETIEWFAQHPEKQLVVRIHPAELVIGTNQPFHSLINNRFRSLPKNIRIIGPKERVNSWSLLSVTDIGLVHTSTVGLELALVGKPCILVSKTHFRGQGFTVDVGSKDEYFALLEEYKPTAEDKRVFEKFAERYAYLWFRRHELEFDFFYEPHHTDVRAFSVPNAQSILKHPTIDLFLDCLEQQKCFVAPSEKPSSCGKSYENVA